MSVLPNRWLRPLCIALVASLTVACSRAGPAAEGPVVLAASSLQESLGEVAATWQRQGHAAPVLSFAATSALARQVEQGAPADVFVSADEAWMNTLEQQDQLRPGSRRDLLTNRLVVVRKRGSELGGLADLGSDRLAIADPAAVPAGRYAREALQSMGQWRGVAARVVPAENVRAALALVERGEAGLGIVYLTDAQAAPGVEVVQEIPARSHTPIRYPAALLAASRHPDAEAFHAFLGSAAAARIFARHGFGLPS